MIITNKSLIKILNLQRACGGFTVLLWKKTTFEKKLGRLSKGVPNKQFFLLVFLFNAMPL